MATNDSGAAQPSLQLRVLVVDDNVDGAQALSALLTTMGCTTAVAYDGALGLAKAVSFVPHLALIDLEMPDMSGCDLVRHLKTNRALGSVRLVCLTGRGQPEDRLLCIEAGFDDFFTKPMRPESLMKVVSAANTRLWQTSPETTASALPSPAAGKAHVADMSTALRGS